MRKASPVNRSVLRERISPSSTVMIWERIFKGWKWKVLENHFENLGPSSLFSDVVSVGHPGLDLAAERLWLHDQYFITTSNFENWRCEWISSAPPSNRLQARGERSICSTLGTSWNTSLEGFWDLFVPPVQSDHHRLPFEKVTVQIPADHVLTARLEEVHNFGKVFGCCIFICYTCHRNHTCQKIHNFELTSHLHSPRTMSKEPRPWERGRLSYVIVLFGLTHRALGEENILIEGTKSNFEAIWCPAFHEKY